MKTLKKNHLSTNNDTLEKREMMSVSIVYGTDDFNDSSFSTNDALAISNAASTAAWVFNKRFDSASNVIEIGMNAQGTEADGVKKDPVVVPAEHENARRRVELDFDNVQYDGVWNTRRKHYLLQGMALAFESSWADGSWRNLMNRNLDGGDNINYMLGSAQQDRIAEGMNEGEKKFSGNRSFSPHLWDFSGYDGWDIDS